MNKYKKGDTVRVKTDLEIGKEYNGYSFSKEMKNTKGNVFFVTRAYDDCSYKLENLPWGYTEEMLEPAESFRFEEGDVVKLNPDAKLGDFPRDEATDTVLRAHKGTTTALEGLIELQFDKEYTVCGKQYGLLKLSGFKSDYLFDACLFTLVRRPEKVKKITMAEIEEKFGCKVEIVKE